MYLNQLGLSQKGKAQIEGEKNVAGVHTGETYPPELSLSAHKRAQEASKPAEPAIELGRLTLQMGRRWWLRQ